ncbi:MAG: hypothetical protein AAB177_18145, partial [Nitrospirota bacterium]
QCSTIMANDERFHVCFSFLELASRSITAQQDAEKVRQHRSRIVQRLNVPKRTPRLFARCGLAGRPF